MIFPDDKFYCHHLAATGIFHAISEPGVDSKRGVEMRSMGLGVALFALWLLLSGHYSGLMMGLGIASCAFTVWLARRMRTVDSEGFPIALAGRAIPYLAWLLREIFISSLKVARIIVSRNLPVSPMVFHAPAAQKSDLGRNIFANSITLTPGTISLEIEGDDRHILVHALCSEMSWGAESCEMDARVARLEGG